MRFPHLLGNERLKQTFSSLPLEKLGSSLLLTGPKGCGKKTAANDIAMAILCTGNEKPCGACPSCVRFSAGTNSDYEFFGGKDAVYNVDNIRAFRSRSFVKSGDSGTKVFLIADADKLNPQSQNALLKVLEEPLNTLFILTCENPFSLLQTVRSRCTLFTVEPLPEETIVTELSKENKYSPAEIKRVSALCGGSLQKARDLLEQGVSPYEEYAVSFMNCLDDEFSLFKLSKDISALSREDYIAFSSRLTELINDALSSSPSPGKLIKIYDYLDKQNKLMPLNPSVTSLSSALTAFCGGLTEE
ncbi:MAG: AAA family ATPase [Clostridia bacterium]|nr:AAA family ATPase [Clostridia bacterium]